MPCALASLSLGGVMQAQNRGDAPIAPAATIGPVTDAPTLSVLGMAALADGAGRSLAQRNDVWFGATQPIGRLGAVRFSALGSGRWRVRDGVSSDAQGQGVVSLRARTRLGEQRVWSAISYGYASSNGLAQSGTLSSLATALSNLNVRSGSDTTVSRRVDVGAIGRAEAGMVTHLSGMELSFGFSVERATRVSTQTFSIDEPDVAPPPSADATRLTSTQTLRTLQHRDQATGIASLGFNTGPTTWLVSVTAPVATWISSDALAPRPSSIPTVASLAVVQPVSGWLSLVGAAATNRSTVGGTALRDEVSQRGRGDFSPVVALGVRIARLPSRGRNDLTPEGILSFETRTLGAVDSLSVEQGASASESDTLRVILLIDAPRAESVELMGDATGWMVTPMTRIRNGRWRKELKLAPGVHRLTVRADGRGWIAPPGLPLGNDDYGSPVGMIIIRGKP